MEQDKLIKESDPLQTVESMDEIELEEMADLFSAFGDVTRIRIMNVVRKQEICVGDLAETLEMSQSAVSHQLKILKQNRLVKSRRDGKQILYSLDDEHVELLLTTGVSHIRERSERYI